MLHGFFSLQVYTVTKCPFKARHFWTRNRVVLYCVGIWLLAFPLAYLLTFGSDSVDTDVRKKCFIVQIVVWSIIVIIQIVLKILTCWEIFKTRRNSRQSHSLKHRQITTTVMIMVGIQIFTAVPFVVIYQLQIGLDYFLMLEIEAYHRPLACLNFSVNPIIYFLRLPDYRSSLLSLLGFRKRTSQTSSDPQRNEQRDIPRSPLPHTTLQPPS